MNQLLFYLILAILILVIAKGLEAKPTKELFYTAADSTIPDYQFTIADLPLTQPTMPHEKMEWKDKSPLVTESGAPSGGYHRMKVEPSQSLMSDLSVEPLVEFVPNDLYDLGLERLGKQQNFVITEVDANGVETPAYHVRQNNDVQFAGRAQPIPVQP